VARPLWSDKGNDPQAVAEHLQRLADTATSFRFEPQEPAAGADLKVLHQAALLRVRKQLALSHAETDRVLAQEVRAIDDLVRSANLMVERLREWYALHAPEATRLVTDAETLAKLVAEKGDRAAVMAALDLAGQAESSLGSDLDPADLAVLRSFAAALAAIHASWHALEERVQALMATVAPNVASVVGPIIGARMIALSGGLNRLATWPAGTVQLLGAETALFRHIKEGTKPPKHGILFQHPSVHQAPPWQRGPVARILSLAAAKAAKADAFTKNDLRPLLAAEVKEGLERIQRERARPPQRRFDARGPRTFGGPRRGPPRDDRAGAGRGPPRGPRAPAPRFGESAAPSPGPRYGGERREAPREPARPFAPARAEGPQGAPGGHGRGGPPGPRGPGGPAPRRFDDRAGRGDRGPPRDGGRGPAPGAGFGGSGGGKPWKRKPQGAFRSDNKPAAPPGRAPRKEDGR
jgi:nucleolar protein 56